MNKKQLVTKIIEPTLEEIPHGYSLPAVVAIAMIIAHESKRGEFIAQVGTGPALGMIQMEPKTHESTWNFGDSIWVNARKLGIITPEQFKNKDHPPAERLLYDIRYNVFMARQRLFMKTEPLPSTLNEISRYLKEHWNSVGGAADDTSYADDYILWGNT